MMMINTTLRLSHVIEHKRVIYIYIREKQKKTYTKKANRNTLT